MEGEKVEAEGRCPKGGGLHANPLRGRWIEKKKIREEVDEGKEETKTEPQIRSSLASKCFP